MNRFGFTNNRYKCFKSYESIMINVLRLSLHVYFVKCSSVIRNSVISQSACKEVPQEFFFSLTLYWCISNMAESGSEIVNAPANLKSKVWKHFGFAKNNGKIDKGCVTGRIASVNVACVCLSCLTMYSVTFLLF